MATEKEMKVQIQDWDEKTAAKSAEFKGIMAHKVKGVKDLTPFKPPELKRTVTSHSRKVYCASWDNDSLHICTAGQEGNVLVTNASTNIIKAKPIVSKFVMQCAVYGDLIACGGMQNLVELHSIANLNKPEKKKDLEGHEGYIAQLHFLEGGAKLLSGSGDGVAIIWDVGKYQAIRKFEGHAADVSGVCINGPDSKIFGTSSTDKTVRIWDMRMEHAVRKFTAKYAANCCAMMPDARGIMCGCDNASYEFFDVGCNQQVARGKVKKGRCESIAISASGRLCYTGWDSGVMLVADSYVPDNRKEMTKENTPKMHEHSVCSLSVAPDGTALCSSSFDTSAKIWGAAAE